MMPSGKHKEYQGGEEEAEFIYNGIIKPALQDALGEDIKINRELDNRKPGAITSAIIHQIAESDIAVVDITGQNPNVFFELGMRYSLRKATTIILRQHDTPIPFDIKNYRCIEYNPFYSGIEKAKQDIKTALVQAAGDETHPAKMCDSLVFEVIQNLEVVIPSPDGRLRTDFDVMPWQIYQSSLRKVIDTAINIVRDGRYVPVAVLGITNGGAMFADLLTRELFSSSVPTVSLWANRANHAGYFDNEINHATVQGIKDIAQNIQNASVLLVDDIVNEFVFVFKSFLIFIVY
jgi:hypothetical protein